MKTTFAVLSCLAAATTALVILPSDQTPLVKDEPHAVDVAVVPEQAAKTVAAQAAPVGDEADDFPVLLIILPTEAEEEEEASDALPALLVDGPTTNDAPQADDDDVVVVAGDFEEPETEDENLGSCFCAGGAVCCVRDGETDCGFGVCGI